MDAPATRVPWTARVRTPAVRGANLLVLSGFAFAQPLLDILGKHAEFFAVRGSGAGDIVLFALAVTFLPALVLLVVELLVGAVDPRAGWALHLILIAVFAAVFAIQALERLGLDRTAPLVALAAVAGVAAAAATARARLFRTFLTVLSPAPLVFLAFFLFGSSVTNLVFADEVEARVADVRANAPVVVVVFDELPVNSLLDGDGAIDAARYPNFARLARGSTWFRNATTLSSSTTRAVPALLTGKKPARRKLPVFQNHPDNLFTLLGGRYRLNVVETQTRLCPRDLCGGGETKTKERLSSLYSDARVVYLHLVAPPALEERLPSIDEAWTGFEDDEAEDLAAGATTVPKININTFHIGRVREFKRFVAAIRPHERGRPALDFLHVLLPHGPWLYFPSGRVSAVARAVAPGRVGELWVDDALALQAYQRHLLQLGYTDRLLGELLAKLERTGIYDRALVVVTADHGISFRGGDKRREPTRTNVQDLAFVPLFVKRPGERRGRVVERHVRILDVLPTIAEGLGIELPWKVDGRSAFAAGEGAPRVQVGWVEGTFGSVLARREEALRRQLELFGSGSWEIFRVGPYGDLVGRPVKSLDVAGTASAEVVVDAAGSRLLRALRERAAAVPSPLAGTISGDDVARGTELAVSLNGRIAAVARVYAVDGELRFSALAADSAFRAGANDVRLYVVAGPPGRPELREASVTLSG